MKKNGFTLIERMIVLVIMGILAAIAIPAFNKAKNHYNNVVSESGEYNRGSVEPPKMSPWCYNGVLFQPNGNQVIGPDGKGVGC